VDRKTLAIKLIKLENREICLKLAELAWQAFSEHAANKTPEEGMTELRMSDISGIAFLAQIRKEGLNRLTIYPKKKNTYPEIARIYLKANPNATEIDYDERVREVADGKYEYFTVTKAVKLRSKDLKPSEEWIIDAMLPELGKAYEYVALLLNMSLKDDEKYPLGVLKLLRDGKDVRFVRGWQDEIAIAEAAQKKQNEEREARKAREARQEKKIREMIEGG